MAQAMQKQIAELRNTAFGGEANTEARKGALRSLADIGAPVNNEAPVNIAPEVNAPEIRGQAPQMLGLPQADNVVPRFQAPAAPQSPLTDFDATQAFKQGGAVSGPSGIDQVPAKMPDGGPARLSDGEYVLPVATVQALGGIEVLDRIVAATNGKPPVQGGATAGLDAVKEPAPGPAGGLGATEPVKKFWFGGGTNPVPSAAATPLPAGEWGGALADQALRDEATAKFGQQTATKTAANAVGKGAGIASRLASGVGLALYPNNNIASQESEDAALRNGGSPPARDATKPTPAQIPALQSKPAPATTQPAQPAVGGLAAIQPMQDPSLAPGGAHTKAARRHGGMFAVYGEDPAADRLAGEQQDKAGYTKWNGMAQLAKDRMDAGMISPQDYQQALTGLQEQRRAGAMRQAVGGVEVLNGNRASTAWTAGVPGGLDVAADNQKLNERYGSTQSDPAFQAQIEASRQWNKSFEAMQRPRVTEETRRSSDPSAPDTTVTRTETGGSGGMSPMDSPLARGAGLEAARAAKATDKPTDYDKGFTASVSKAAGAMGGEDDKPGYTEMAARYAPNYAGLGLDASQLASILVRAHQKVPPPSKQEEEARARYNQNPQDKEALNIVKSFEAVRDMAMQERIDALLPAR